jgi:hypothetical protein
VIAPKAQLVTASGPFAGWWRIDPASGATQGVGANGLTTRAPLTSAGDS